MNKFLEWIGRNRRPIGYTIGALNILAAVNYAVLGEFGMAVLWSAIGFMLVWDAAEVRPSNDSK